MTLDANTKASNPQPIRFSGILFAKLQNSFQLTCSKQGIVRFQKIGNSASKRGTAFYLIIILLNCIVYVACCIAIKCFHFVGPMSMVHHTLVLPWCEKMRISERLISDVFIKNIWMVLKKCVFLWTIYK